MTSTRFFAALAFLCLLAAAPQAAPAKVVSAVLFPDAARVTEEAVLALVPDDGQLSGTLTLPQFADPGTLSLRLGPDSGLRLAGTAVRTVRRRDEGRIREVTAALEKARETRQALADALAVRDAGAAFWKSQAAGARDKAAEARAMAAALREGLGAELAAASALRRDVKAQDEKVAELERELQRLTGGAESVHEVTLQFSGPARTSVPARYSYRMAHAGWTPAYSLEAVPAEGRVRFAWDALVRQSSGADWTGAALSLATAETRGGAEPPALRPWVLRPRAMRPMADMKAVAAPRAALMENAAGAAPAPAPERSRGEVFDVYELGPVTLASGRERRLEISREAWPARFDRLVRPYAEPRAYLRARLTLDETPRIPAGRADFLLDGALVASRPFALAEREAELFFGADPQIAVKFEARERKSGESGLFAKTRRHGWTWALTLVNGSSRAARVSVEDALPRQGDERIEIRRELDGGTAREDGTVAWDFELAPGAEKTLEYGYTASWPSDLDLDLGGR